MTPKKETWIFCYWDDYKILEDAKDNTDREKSTDQKERSGSVLSGNKHNDTGNKQKKRL